jgi:hypothetical protein
MSASATSSSEPHREEAAVRRHRFDPFSFVFGLLFVALSTWALVGEDASFDSVWVWPVVMIIGGLTLLISLLTDRRDDRTVPREDTAAASDADTSLAAAHDELPTDPFAGE